MEAHGLAREAVSAPCRHWIRGDGTPDVHGATNARHGTGSVRQSSSTEPSQQRQQPDPEISGSACCEQRRDLDYRVGYGLPMSRMPPNSMRLVTSRAEQSLDSNLQSSQNSGLQNEVHECDHERAYLKILGIQSVGFNNGLSLACRLCGGRWQRLLRTRPDSNFSVSDGVPLNPYQVGIPLPLPPGSPRSKEAVQCRLALEGSVAAARIELPNFFLHHTTFPHHVIMIRWPSQAFR